MGRNRFRRLMRLMGLVAAYPKPGTKSTDIPHRVYPFRLHELTIGRLNQVWSAVVAYIPMHRAFMYPGVVMD